MTSEGVKEEAGIVNDSSYKIENKVKLRINI